MTGAERADLKLTLEFLREWRDDDKEWKDKADKRLAALEKRVVVEDAVSEHTASVAAKVVDAAKEANLSRRWRVGIVLGIGATLLIGLANIALKLAGIE